MKKFTAMFFALCLLMISFSVIGNAEQFLFSGKIQFGMSQEEVINAYDHVLIDKADDTSYDIYSTQQYLTTNEKDTIELTNGFDYRPGFFFNDEGKLNRISYVPLGRVGFFNGNLSQDKASKYQKMLNALLELFTEKYGVPDYPVNDLITGLVDSCGVGNTRYGGEPYFMFNSIDLLESYEWILENDDTTVVDICLSGVHCYNSNNGPYEVIYPRVDYIIVDKEKYSAIDIAIHAYDPEAIERQKHQEMLNGI